MVTWDSWLLTTYTHGFDRLNIDCHFHLPTKFWPCRRLRLDTRRQDVKVEPLTKLYTLRVTKPPVSYTESLGCRPAWAKDFLSSFELLDSKQRSSDCQTWLFFALGQAALVRNSTIEAVEFVSTCRAWTYPQYPAPPCISCLSDIQHSMVQVFILQMPTLQIIWNTKTLWIMKRSHHFAECRGQSILLTFHLHSLLRRKSAEGM